ncbi:hypothetical protein EU642_21765 [Salmonella enterica]|nr:hypothetical protein [Salmonella enterica]EAR6391598.1 hypothetical protein [Salmonella enterica]EAV1285243.1 hypothetical protein [Salmonella enterica]
MARDKLSWTASEFQMKELAHQVIGWWGSRRGVQRSAVANLAAQVVIHDRLLTKARIHVHKD